MKSSWDNFWERNPPDYAQRISWSKQRMVLILEKYLSAPKRIMDAGCGSGFFSKFFCDGGHEAIALDYSTEALALTQKNTQGRVQIVRADLILDQLKTLLNQQVDIIFSDGLLEHFSSDQQDLILKNFISVLSPQGLIITFAPNRWSPWQLVRPFMMPGIKEQPFTMKELCDLSVRNGLQVIAKGGINTLPFKLSPEGRIAETFGMLLYTIAKKSL